MRRLLLLCAALVVLLGACSARSAGARGARSTAPQPPVTHVIEIMLENHTFDDLFGDFAGARGIEPGTTLPAPRGSTGTVAPITAGPNQGEVQAGLNNSRSAELSMMDRSDDHYTMDGYTGYPGEGLSAITTFPPSDLPNLWAAARGYELFDANFQPVIAPTLPNVLAALTGTNHGWVSNDEPPAALGWHSIFDELSATHHESAFYSGVPASVYAGTVWQRVLVPGQQVEPLTAFYRALATATLPAFSFVRPGVGYSEEAPEDVSEGDAWLDQLLAAIGASRQWSSTAVFITYDEGGGFWDGVAPPVASGYGTRTPMVLVSPYARRGVFSGEMTNLSVLSYLDSLFHLAPLTPLQGRQNDLERAVDYRQRALPPPKTPDDPAMTFGFYGSSLLADPGPALPGKPFRVSIVEQSRALQPVTGARAVQLRLTPPSGVSVPSSFPSELRLTGGRAALNATLTQPGYYRLRASAPGAVGFLTIDVGVGPNTP